jgi:hypothetical protein
VQLPQVRGEAEFAPRKNSLSNYKHPQKTPIYHKIRILFLTYFD